MSQILWANVLLGSNTHRASTNRIKDKHQGNNLKIVLSLSKGPYQQTSICSPGWAECLYFFGTISRRVTNMESRSTLKPSWIYLRIFSLKWAKWNQFMSTRTSWFISYTQTHCISWNSPNIYPVKCLQKSSQPGKKSVKKLMTINHMVLFFYT